MPEHGRNLIPVHSWKADVEQHNLGPVSSRHLDGARSVMNGLHVVAKKLEEPFQPVDQVDIVVDDEDSYRFTNGTHRSRDQRFYRGRPPCRWQSNREFASVVDPL